MASFDLLPDARTAVGTTDDSEVHLIPLDGLGQSVCLVSEGLSHYPQVRAGGSWVVVTSTLTF